ncbi:hypothetical protein [Sulfitobacter sp. 1A13730]|uniref:hypothetical protein n=1 Tax=Sulfitobacter sp. 1A13730 TaxID=3368569 RepID=UPI0037461CE9
MDKMDIRWFLKQRLDFIRIHYDCSASAFLNTVRQIENGEAPFDTPPYTEDGEPAFQKQWEDANTSIDLIGISCVSLLSDALKLYLNSLKRIEFRFEFDETEQKALKNGYVFAFKAALGKILNTDWVESGVDFEILEQVVLARNQGQHGNDITGFRFKIDAKTIRQHPRPIFGRTEEIEAMDGQDLAVNNFLGIAMKIDRASLFSAIDEIEKLSDWVELNRERALPWFEKQRFLRQARAEPRSNS